MPAPLYVIYQSKWGFSAGVLTLVFAIYSAGVLTALLVFGRISDEVGRTRVLGAALAVAIASTLVFVFATGVADADARPAPLGLRGRADAGHGDGGARRARAAPRRPPRGARQRRRHTGAVGLGPLLAGVLAEYAGWKTHLVFVVYLVLLVLALLAVALVPETVADRHRPRLRVQRLVVPHGDPRAVLSAALAMFSAFAVVGLFVSLVPSFLGHELHRRTTPPPGSSCSSSSRARPSRSSRCTGSRAAARCSSASPGCSPVWRS